MIFSIVEKVSEREAVQKVLVKGKSEEIATELKNIIKEILKNGFPEELMFSAIIEAVGDLHK